MKKYQGSALLLLFLFLISCHEKTFTPEEADRSMKILNGNLVNLLNSGAEKPEFKALSFLINQPSSPLPIVKNSNLTLPDTVIFDFDKRKGIYNWNNVLKAFEKTGSSDLIRTNFPAEKSESNNISVDLSKFKSQTYSSRPALPTEINAVFRLDDQEIASVEHSATIANNLPETINTAIKGLDYNAGFILKRTQYDKNGEIFLDMYLRTKGFEVIAGKLKSQIEYSKMGYFIKTVSFDLKLVDHTVHGEINYSAIDPTSADYISSFNTNSKILVFEGKRLLGNVVLGKTENGDLLDYFIRFSNGEEKLLSYYLPFLKKVLNLKY